MHLCAVSFGSALSSQITKPRRTPLSRLYVPFRSVAHNHRPFFSLSLPRKPSALKATRVYYYSGRKFHLIFFHAKRPCPDTRSRRVSVSHYQARKELCPETKRRHVFPATILPSSCDCQAGVPGAAAHRRQSGQTLRKTPILPVQSWIFLLLVRATFPRPFLDSLLRNSGFLFLLLLRCLLDRFACACCVNYLKKIGVKVSNQQRHPIGTKVLCHFSMVQPAPG